MRHLIAVLVLTLVLCGCDSGDASPPISHHHNVSPIRFKTLREAFAFLASRHERPTTSGSIERLMQSSKIKTIRTQGKQEFCIIDRFACPGFNANAPMYILAKQNGKYALLGGFLGSGVKLAEVDGQLEAHVYDHMSAKRTPPTIYKLKNGLFNEIRPAVSGGDLFK